MKRKTIALYLLLAALPCLGRYTLSVAVDVLIRYIIFICTMVNNAIVVVRQPLHNVRYNNVVVVAVISGTVTTQVRPIFMSATTQHYWHFL
jgi:multidrug efflux pump subunit AcrB